MTKSRYVLLCFLIGVGIILLSCKSDLSKGVDSYYEGDYDKALEHLAKVRYDDKDYDKAVRLIAEIISIPKVVTERVMKRTFPIETWASGELICSHDFKFRGYMDNSDCIKISVGDTCEVGVLAFPREKFIGVVTEISNERLLTRNGDTVRELFLIITPDSYKHTISKIDSNSYLRSGMTLRAKFITGYLHDVLCVPWDAVVHSRYNDEVKYVFVYLNEMVWQKSVKLGYFDGVFIEIIEGLDEGEEVVDNLQSPFSGELKSGQKVIKVEREDIYE